MAHKMLEKSIAYYINGGMENHKEVMVGRINHGDKPDQYDIREINNRLKTIKDGLEEIKEGLSDLQRELDYENRQMDAMGERLERLKQKLKGMSK